MVIIAKWNKSIGQWPHVVWEYIMQSWAGAAEEPNAVTKTTKPTSMSQCPPSVAHKPPGTCSPISAIVSPVLSKSNTLVAQTSVKQVHL